MSDNDKAKPEQKEVKLWLGVEQDGYEQVYNWDFTESEFMKHLTLAGTGVCTFDLRSKEVVLEERIAVLRHRQQVIRANAQKEVESLEEKIANLLSIPDLSDNDNDNKAKENSDDIPF